MLKKNKAEPSKTAFVTDPTLEIDGFTINAGDIIKVHGQYGSRFKFIGVTTNSLTGESWIDCYEIMNGVSSVFRSFKKERIKRIPKRGKRAKRVNN
jgi:hypothetical protein